MLRTACRSMMANLPRTSAALLLLAWIPAQAAPLFTFSKITSEADVINSGTILRATNLGSSAQGTFNPVTVNGVNFGTDTTGISGMTPGGGDFNTEFGSGSPLDQLLSGTWYNPGGSSTLTLSGLTAGEDYVYQMFLSNMVNSTGWASRVTVQGVGFNLAGIYDGTAHSLRVDFTATGTSEVITFGTGSTSQSARMQFNAFSLQTVDAPVPAPTTALLIGLGGLLFARRRLKTTH